VQIILTLNITLKVCSAVFNLKVAEFKPSLGNDLFSPYFLNCWTVTKLFFVEKKKKKQTLKAKT